jgi:hypothetical protein
MASTNPDTFSTAPSAPTKATGWTGWVGFAAFIMMLSGTLTAIQGLIAMINHNWSQFNNDGAPYGTAYGWGWWNLVIGLFVFGIGLALLRGHMFARIVAVFVAAGSLISQFVSLNITPLWSLTVITIDLLVIWAVMVHGEEMQVL